MTTLAEAKNYNKKLFYQSKYDYYKNFIRGLIIVSSLAYIAFFITDCQLFGRFSYETAFPRLFILIPLAIYIVLHKKIKDYRIMVPVSYLMVHVIIWCTDWATYILPDRQYASEGMIVMNLIFVCAGFCSPFWYSTIAHSIMILDIIVANMFIHYDDVGMMVMFNLPCVVAVCAMHRIMEKVYLDHYLVSCKLENLVVHDQLTGVYNRNKLKELCISSDDELMFKKDQPVGILIVDIDFFKKVNDKYGHEAGDIVLKHTAKIIQSAVRASDYVIRWGGEEFLIITQGCNEENGVRIAEKIRETIENTDNGVCPVTVSIGVTGYRGGNYHDDVERADKALYKAKVNGRNQVVKYIEE